MREILLLLFLIVTHGLKLENNTVDAEANSTVANPTKGIIDLEDEDSIAPMSNERQMIEQQNMNAPSKVTNILSKDEEPSKHNKKLSKIIEKHEEMGEELKSLKKDLQEPKDDSSQGWKNIENYFQG